MKTRNNILASLQSLISWIIDNFPNPCLITLLYVVQDDLIFICNLFSSCTQLIISLATILIIYR